MAEQGIYTVISTPQVKKVCVKKKLSNLPVVEEKNKTIPIDYAVIDFHQINLF